MATGFYVFFRCWPGFNGEFDFDQFNHLPDDAIEDAVAAYAEEWLKQHPDEVYAATTARTMARTNRPSGFRARVFDLIPGLADRFPDPAPRPEAPRSVTLSPEQTIRITAGIAGWARPPFTRFTDPLVSERHFVFRADTQADAKRARQDLQAHYEHDRNGFRFGILPEDGFGLNERVGIEATIRASKVGQVMSEVLRTLADIRARDNGEGTSEVGDPVVGGDDGWPPDHGLHFRPLEVAWKGKRHDLSGTLHALFEKLASRRAAWSDKEIGDAVWGEPEKTGDAIRADLSRLRGKLKGSGLTDLAGQIQTRDGLHRFAR